MTDLFEKSIRTLELPAVLEKLAAKALRDGNKDLSATLEQDREALAQGRTFPAVDRYLPLIYPQLATAAASS